MMNKNFYTMYCSFKKKFQFSKFIRRNSAELVEFAISLRFDRINRRLIRLPAGVINAFIGYQSINLINQSLDAEKIQ